MSKIITATALSLIMATSALAASTVSFDATQSKVFLDDKGTLRSSAEAKTRFEALPADEQSKIRMTCTEYRAASSGSGSTDTTTTGSTTTTTTTKSSSGANASATMVSSADMGKVCDMVQTF
jgi:hypothetical protein